MTTALRTDGSRSVARRLSRDILDFLLDRIAAAIRAGSSCADDIGRLRALVEDCVPDRASGPTQLGALPETLGTVVTLQYPLMQLELFLSRARSDIADGRQAELYLSFVRYHVWKLEHLLRESARS